MPKLHHPNEALPGHAACLDILRAGLAGADPQKAVQGTLEAGEYREFLEVGERLFVVGAGKAGAPMARAAEAMLRERIDQGLVVVKDGHLRPTERVEVMEAAHPVPDGRSVRAARRIVEICDGAGSHDRVLCLISGGGSALMEWPVEGVSVEQLQAVHDTLVTSGVAIDGINAVRKHLSRVKGGRLAGAIWPARSVTLVVSDVVGNPLDVIASGPTVGDSSSFADALAVLEEAGLVGGLPAAAVEHLRAGARGDIEETPGPAAEVFSGSAVEVVADRRDAVRAARRRAEAAGWEVQVLGTEVEGEAREVGRRLVARARQVVAGRAADESLRVCLLAAGETTVTVQGDGLGGRNQEVALAAALALQEMRRAGALPTGVDMTVGSLATDGGDGPAGDAHGAAGGIVDAGTVQRGLDESLDARAFLERNDAYHLLEATGDIVTLGPTCTNVNDLMCLLLTE